MRVGIGTSVKSQDGKDAGRIDKLVVNRDRREVMSIVLRLGVLVHHDVLVERETFVPGEGDEPQVTLDAEFLRSLPEYTEPDLGAGPSLADTASQAELSAALARQAMETAVLKDGSAIRSSDGKKIGTLHQAAFETSTGRLTDLVMRKGALFAEDIPLPASLIQEFGEREIMLRVPESDLEMWSKLRPGMDVYTADDVCLGTLRETTSEYLEIAQIDRDYPLYVPLSQISQTDTDRVLLRADSTHAQAWRIPPSAEPPPVDTSSTV